MARKKECANAAKHSAHSMVRWTDSILAGEFPNGIVGIVVALLGGLTLSGILPLLLTVLLIWILDPIPSWVFLVGLCAALIAIAVYLWRSI